MIHSSEESISILKIFIIYKYILLIFSNFLKWILFLIMLLNKIILNKTSGYNMILKVLIF